METLLFLSLSVSVVLAALLIRERTREISVQYLPEIDAYHGIFKRQKIVRIKAQILCNGLPIGPTFTVSEQKTVEVDQNKINEIVKAVSEPMVRAGIKAVLPA